ncbi:hypothetical protein P389DRAFT_108369 [Cystobasidium minutum MCA 4210]|uniref:uncharacterized protein n=1 Tax=Cystobasidium minutum MCA 4210 TaxID=1397322 RepID=UPI0034CEEBD4|eukprot:jgi/Rhomi1/108369/CE108368_6492
MVNLTITPHRGNGARTFPSTGYLGLTPVSLAGVVRVKIEEDMKTVQASSLVVRVRCYESIGGNHQSSSSSSASTSNTATNDKSSYSSTSPPSNGQSSTSGYHLSSCLGSSSAGYSFTDIWKGSSSSASSTSSPSSSASKGRVLYEKSITMWTPPTPTTSSTPLSSRSPSSGQSEEEKQEDDVEGSPGRGQHAYPPRRQLHTTSSRSRSVTYGTLGEFTKAWRIVIPPEAVEKGAKSTMIYKNWKIWWAVEAVISHRPQGIHGDRIIKSHQLALLSYAPRCRKAQAPEWLSSPLSNYPLTYSITTPTTTFGSADPVDFHVELTKNSYNAETPKKVSLELRREILFGPTHADSPTSPIYGTSAESSASTSSQSHSKKRIPHHRTNSGTLSNLLPTSSNSRLKSESTEALIVTTPPPLSNTSSTLSSFSTLTPSTPPAFSPTYEKISPPTPADYAESVTSEFYFGLFNGGPSRKASIGTLSEPEAKDPKYAAQHARFTSPPPPILLSAPPISASAKRHAPNNSKKEDITLATFEVDCAFTSPTWSGRLTGNMPRVKSLYHYALGETCQTPSQTSFTNPHTTTSSSRPTPLSPTVGGGARSRFYLVPKIHYKNKNAFIELPPLDIMFYAVSQEERKKAVEMIPKINAIQAAEVKLFGGGEELAVPSTIEKTGKKPYSNMPSHPASAHHAHRQSQKVSSSSTSARPRTSQSVSPKVGTGRSAHPLPALHLPEAMPDEAQDDVVRLSTVRRRSEQAEDSLDCPRTRQRFASIPDLSPIVGSPYSDALSPSLSVTSNSTTRPRSTFRSRPTTANSTKTNYSRPRSSAGLDLVATISTSSSTYTGASFAYEPVASETSAVDLSQVASQSSLSTPPILSSFGSASSSSPRTSSASDSSMDLSPKSTASISEYHHQSPKSVSKNYSYGPGALTPASVNGLFADFSGFSLRPPENLASGVPLIREELVAPKATTPSSSSKHRQGHAISPVSTTTTSNKRKSTEILASPGPAKMIPSKSANGSTVSSSSSSLVFLHEVTLASPPASISVNPNSVARNSSLSPKGRSSTMSKVVPHNTSSDALSPLVDGTSLSGNSARKSKGGMSGAFSFFRRSSARI